MLLFEFIGFLSFLLVQKAATKDISQYRNFQHEVHSTSKPTNVTLSRADYTDETELLTEVSGTIMTPNYPGNYFDNLRCQWLIRVPDGYRVKLSFASFHTDPCCDILWIYDGPNDSSSLLRKVSGTSIPSDIYSTKNEVFLRFETGAKGGFVGFVLNYVISCRKSSILLTEPEGYVSLPSANMKNHKENSITCSWLIRVEPGFNLNINLKNLHLELCSSCNCDSLEIYDGPSTSAAPLGKFCTNNHPSEMQSTANQVYIRFESKHASTFDSGFYVHYRTICFCGKGHRCEVVKGRKICYCKDKFENNNGICEECDCGPGHSCEFDFGKKKCRLLQPLIDDGEKCEECISSDGYRCSNIGGRKVCISVDKQEINEWPLEECSCGNESTCVFKDREKVCVCNQGYALKDGMCKECSCGKDSSCIFKEGEKMCLCRKGYVEKDGICKECSCGNESTCVFKDGEKVCVCNQGYALKDGMCKECSCGKDSSCIFKEGEKMCLCRKGYVEKDGICKECTCGNFSISCGFEDGEKVCLCKKGYEWKDGACKVSSPY